MLINFYIFLDPESGEFFIVTNKETSTEHVIQFSVSLRGKPAIIGKICLFEFFCHLLNS